MSGDALTPAPGGRPPTLDEVASFVRGQTACPGPLTAATTLQADLGVDGDDMDEFLSAYSARFGVDLAGYLWYFHAGEEGFGIGGLFIPPPYRRVAEIPITLGMLRDFAALGRWGVEYPPHEIPGFRGDTLIDRAFGGVVLAACLARAIWWWAA